MAVASFADELHSPLHCRNKSLRPATVISGSGSFYVGIVETLSVFEFHGWATIRVDDRDDADLDVIHGRQEVAIVKLREAMKKADDAFSFFELRRTSNGILVLLAHGLRNHRFQPVIDLFCWVTIELPFSYGLVYIHDDEDTRRGADYANAFRVWRLARGEFGEFADPFLSSYVPTVEQPWVEPPNGEFV